MGMLECTEVATNRRTTDDMYSINANMRDVAHTFVADPHRSANPPRSRDVVKTKLLLERLLYQYIRTCTVCVLPIVVLLYMYMYMCSSC